MPRLIAATLVLATIGPSVPVLAAAPPTPVLSPKGVTDGKIGDVIFFEDFATIDRSRWNIEVSGATVYNNEQQVYIDSPDVLSIVTGADADGVDNALQIKPVFHKGYAVPGRSKADFVSGRMDSKGKVEFTYGSVAARMKLTNAKGLWLGFWSMGSAGAWPSNGEIDILESAGDPAWSSVAVHGPGYSGNTPIVHTNKFPAGSDSTGWHVYSIDWTKDGLVFRTDGVEHYRVTKANIQQYGAWKFDSPQYLLVNVAVGGVFPQSRNRPVSPLYPGLPAQTVDLIKNGKGRMLVDWIKVTKIQ